MLSISSMSPRSYKILSALLGLGLFILILMAITMGATSISILAVIQILLNGISTTFQGVLVSVPDWQHTIVYQIRLPRVILAMLIGATLAVCGAVLQGLFRNPLASPSVLGVSSGASLGASIAIFLGLSAQFGWALPLFAFIGAVLTLLLVYRIATRAGKTPMATLLLAGVAVGAFNLAMSSLILALALQDWEIGKSIVYWSMGGLEGRSWQHVGLILPMLLIGGLIIALYHKDLDVLLIGEVHAHSMGVDVAKVRLHLLVVTALLTGCAVSVAGGIGFVGLVVPHIGRLLVGPHHARLLPFSALLGGVVLVLADLVVRGEASHSVIPLGVVTAALGAPFFLFLLLRQQRLVQG